MENLQKLLNQSLQEYIITFYHPWFNNELFVSYNIIEELSQEIFKQIIIYGECKYKVTRLSKTFLKKLDPINYKLHIYFIEHYVKIRRK